MDAERNDIDDPSPAEVRRDNWVLACASIAAFCLIASVVAVAIALGSSGDGSAGAAPTTTKDVEVELGDMFIKPAKISVPAGTKVTFHVRNTGAMAHDFKVEGKRGVDLLQPGKAGEFTTEALQASTQGWCTVPGHKAAGMVMAIAVTGAAGGAAAATAQGAPASAEPTGATIDPQAVPADGWKPFDPTLRPAPGGKEHKVQFDATEVTKEVAPGVTQKLWTFNDQVPGPILRGKVGDVFTVTLTNKGTMGHSIDFHASKVAWSDEMRTIQPGESLVYQYQAKYAGIFMYHCGTAPALHHIGNGMFGAIIIDPPDLPKVDHEYVMVQSELYLGPQGKEGDLTKMQHEAFDAVVFNGYVNQYKFAPIRVEPKERIRVWVLDAGPNEDSSFHIVGTVFDTVFKEGTKVLSPDARQGGAQALDLQPAQGGYVEFSFDEEGFYPMVTHKFANVGKGAMGLFQAGDVTMPEGASH
ncbi:MAG: multicopper oxidase domain-containing protein [Acidimicrobiales bacterium]